jgi:hypothetical protein
MRVLLLQLIDRIEQAGGSVGAVVLHHVDDVIADSRQRVQLAANRQRADVERQVTDLRHAVHDAAQRIRRQRHRIVDGKRAGRQQPRTLWHRAQQQRACRTPEAHQIDDALGTGIGDQTAEPGTQEIGIDDRDRRPLGRMPSAICSAAWRALALRRGCR